MSLVILGTIVYLLIGFFLVGFTMADLKVKPVWWSWLPVIFFWPVPLAIGIGMGIARILF